MVLFEFIYFYFNVSNFYIVNSAPLLLSGWRGKASAHLLSTSSEKRMLQYLYVPKTGPAVVEEKQTTPLDEDKDAESTTTKDAQ